MKANLIHVDADSLSEIASDIEASDKAVRIASRNGHIPHLRKYGKQRDSLRRQLTIATNMLHALGG